MKHLIPVFAAMLSIACAQTKQRNAEVTAREELERKKPLLQPRGGSYFKPVEVRILNFEPGWEYSTGNTFVPLERETLTITASATLVVRPLRAVDLASTEIYQIENAFPTLQLQPPAGTYDRPVTISVTTALQNSRIEFSAGGDFSLYDGETGIPVTATSDLKIRQCVAHECSDPASFLYQIALAEVHPPLPTAPQTPRSLTPAEIQTFRELAAGNFHQLAQEGLAARMDEAKLLVIQDASLIADASRRQRFLAQSNTTTAAEACTIVARYLYVAAKRLTLGPQSLAALEDFPHYYIRHIALGNITTDSGGRNFNWVLNGTAMVNPYLPDSALMPFSFNRGSAYPTDYSLIDKLSAVATHTTLLRDGPSGSSHTHTFLALRSGESYEMIDTYFMPFNGIALKASAGKSWPYAFRFGPAGSRYLHFVYGY